MLLLLIVISILAATAFIVTPAIWLILGKLFKIKYLNFKNAIITCLLLTLIGVAFQIITLGLTFVRLNNIIFDLTITVASLVIVILIIKYRFKTTVMKSVGLYISMVIVAVFVALTIRTYVVQAFKIPSGSMNQSVLVGDYILVNKYLYNFSDPERGDIIVFQYPKDKSKDYFMRIVATGGEGLEIVDKQLIINKKQITEPYKFHKDTNILPGNYQSRDNLKKIVVPENAYFVMGDNRDYSNDSRYWGFVERKLIKGKAIKIYWSWDKKSEAARWDRIGKTL